MLTPNTSALQYLEYILKDVNAMSDHISYTMTIRHSTLDYTQMVTTSKQVQESKVTADVSSLRPPA